MSEFYELSALDIQGKEVNLSEYKNKIVLVVNVASKCGFTPQYAGLEALYQKYRENGFVILGFPCNQFGHQEPGTEKDIAEFCSLNYNVSFPIFAKVDVNGANAHPVYQFLKKQAPGLLGTEAIKWNFTKFLVNANGEVIERFSPQTTPESLNEIISKLL